MSFICCIASVICIVTLIYVCKIIMSYESSVSLMSCLFHTEWLRHLFFPHANQVEVYCFNLNTYNLIHIHATTGFFFVCLLLLFWILIYMFYIFFTGKSPIINQISFFAQIVSLTFQFDLKTNYYYFFKYGCVGSQSSRS